MRNLTLPVLAACSLAVFATPAAAEPASVSVSYRDLDLSTDAGMRALEGRMNAAARQICGHVQVRDIHDGSDYARCMKETHVSASAQIARLSGNRAVLALNSPRH